MSGATEAPVPREGDAPGVRGPAHLALRESPGPWARRLLGLGSVGLVILLWWLATRGPTPETRLVSPVLLPSPAEVLASLPSLIERDLLASVVATLRRVFLGFGLVVVLGVPLGILAGSWRLLDAAAAPLAVFGRNIPIAALIPMTILWFGIDETQKVMFIFVACVPFVFSDAVVALLAVHERYVDTAMTLGASHAQVVRKVLVPLAMPDVFNNLRNLFGLAFGYIMLAELINAQHGLGYLLSTSQRRGLIEHIIIILMLIGALAYGIDRLLYWFQRGLFPHTKAAE